MVALAKGEFSVSRSDDSALTSSRLPANFKTGEKQLITLIEGMWKRKRAQRLAASGRLE